MNLPETIRLQIVTKKMANLKEIIVQIKVISGNKNPYHILFPKTNEAGCAILTKEDFVGQFKDHWEEGLMDYNGTVDTADPIVEISLFNPHWLIANKKLALAWPLFQHEKSKWKERREEYEYKTTCHNKKYKAKIMRVNIEKQNELEYEIEPL